MWGLEFVLCRQRTGGDSHNVGHGRMEIGQSAPAQQRGKLVGNVRALHFCVCLCKRDRENADDKNSFLKKVLLLLYY